MSAGGTAACVTAGRLAKASPHLRILILETGPLTKDVLTHVQPARFAAHLVPGAETVRFHFDRMSDALGGRQGIVVAGQCLGGGSSVNCNYSLSFSKTFSGLMADVFFPTVGMYTRGAQSDYDGWENEFNNPGWGFNNLLPLFQKVCFQDGFRLYEILRIRPTDRVFSSQSWSTNSWRLWVCTTSKSLSRKKIV